MSSLQESMQEYHAQLKKGVIQQAYQGLMAYLMNMRTRLAAKYPDYLVSGSVYAGYMDMSYFSFTPPALKERGLKIAIVFVHPSFRFEVWLAAANKQVQTRYWKRFKQSGWEKYPLVKSPQGADAILEHTLVAEPDFNDLEALTRQVEQGTLQFTQEVEKFLDKP